MSPQIVVRRLGPGDVVHLRSLNRIFATAFEDPAAYGANPPGNAYLRDVLAKDHVVALAAFAGAELVGGLVAYELEKLEQERREFYIYDLAVAAEHRRKGVATSLIAQVRAIAAQRRGWVVFVQADYGDDPAIRLYERLGSREDVMHFDIPVDQGR